MRFELTSKENDETGEIGWLDARIPRASEIYGPFTGAALAHDMMEHFAFEHVGSEIEAHGAIYRLRYETGWQGTGLYGRNLRIDDLASDWTLLVRAMFQSYLPVPPNTRPLDSYIESDIDEIIEAGRKACVAEFAYGGPMEDSDRDNLAIVTERFRAYFRIGYRKANRRYRNAHNAAHLYNVLAERMDKLKPELEGQRIVVNVNLKTCEVKIREIELPEYA